MSRVYDGGYEWESEEEERAFNDALRAEYKAIAPDFAGFVAWLDAMESKRIISDRFFKPRTGEVCSVAAFCRFKGFDDATMREYAKESAEERRDYDGTEAPYDDGATVRAGGTAGLPGYVAQDLVWRNDEAWHHVVKSHHKCTCTGKPGFHYPYNGEFNHGCKYGSPIYRDMTPEERWFKLRNFCARKAGVPLVDEPAAMNIPEFIEKSS